LAAVERRIGCFLHHPIGDPPLTSMDKNPCYSGTDYSGTTQSPPLKPQL